MFDTREPPGGGVPQAGLVGEVTRASLAYIRDNVRVSRGDGDLLTALLFTAILDANVGPVNRDPELRVLYGRPGDPCPDELRRPVAINAVAQSLGTPFETARRRVRELIRAGECVVTPRGVYVPARTVASPAYTAIQMARYEQARALYRALRDAGAAPPEPPVAASGDPLVRAVNGAVSEYMLRACADLIGLTGDMLGSLILVELTLQNIAGLPPDRLPAWATDPAALARPVRGKALSAQLRLSAETVRRHAMGLEAAGFLLRRSDGWIAVCPPAARDRVAQLIETNLANLQRLFARLRELEVTAAWEAEDAAARAEAAS